ncbi:MAG: gamma-glutamyl-gamma-aminobutyrate hydrolase family protein [Frankiales bacterium]|nr:gamma-glutamyl-gamma-aminobutyrate hydrolase family protein [Frankiales bacterium]
MRPVIGVSCYGERASWGAWDVDAVVLHRAYVEALEESGAAVVVVPPVTDEASLDAIVARLDGLVLAGGADVNPADYGAAAHETTDRPRLDRDRTERRLYRAARVEGLPVLGICRGMQVMAVESGGSLLQDLPSAGYGLTHRERPGEFVEHGAVFAEGSLVARILGTTSATVNSSHHQAVADPGSLRVTGHAADGTIEVLEDPDAAFVLGVQWHPEMGTDRRLFEALVGAARHTGAAV